MADEPIVDRTVADSVREYLRKLKQRDAELADGPLACSALALAREMDANNSATSKSMCAKALNETLEQLRALAPPVKQEDTIDELSRERDKRRAKAAG